MAKLRKTLRGQFANSTGVLLAASSTVTRWIRSWHVANNTNAAKKFSLAYAPTATSSGPGVFEESLPANTAGASSRADRYYHGDGHRLDNTAIAGFSDVVGVSYEIVYDEQDLT
jgi:hypothetical protein